MVVDVPSRVRFGGGQGIDTLGLDDKACRALARTAAVLGIAVSVIVNLIFLVAVVLLGQRLIDAMPEPMAVALRNYTFPALYGAVFVMFLQTARTRSVAVVGTAVALVVLVLPISPVFSATVAGVLGIIASFAMARRTPPAADAAV